MAYQLNQLLPVLRTDQLQEAHAVRAWYAPVGEQPTTARHGGAFEPPELAIIIPTLNERDNIEELLQRLDVALSRVRWEVIFVDDDSGDGTLDLLHRLMRSRPDVRAMRRIGRRGLSSACIEGILATSAPFLAVMDADMQHDERILPVMLKQLRENDLDVAVGTRFGSGGSVGDFSEPRLRISRLGRLLSRAISRADLSDPMSGFFVLRRTFFEDTVRQLSGHGFKILLDVFASARRPVHFVEVPYRFGSRLHGQSKLDTLVVLEFLMLFADKLLGRYVPVRFVLFILVGLLGLVIHLTTLGLCFKGIQISFYAAQVIATLVAMTFNFNLNNLLTYRDRRLRGRYLIYGHLSFYLVCSIGAIANFQIAEMLYGMHVPWALAGLLGALVGAVWNYGVSLDLHLAAAADAVMR